ncbi:MAG: BACON domain-containing protein [Mangrovibacterium sp.]
MKQIQLKTKLKTLAMAALAVFAVSCEDEETPPPEPTFPVAEEMSATQPGDTDTLRFDANYAWSLETDKAWCQFVATEAQTIDGEVGAHEVVLQITEDGWAFGVDDEAIIKMTMNEITKTVATVVRGEKAYVITVTGVDADENEIVYDAENPITFVYNTTTARVSATVPITITGNFAWTLEAVDAEGNDIIGLNDYSQLNEYGMIAQIADTCKEGTVDTPKSFALGFYGMCSRSGVKEGKLVFKNAVGVKKAEVPIYYGGYPKDYVNFTSSPTELANTCKNDFWFGAKGDTYWYLKDDAQKGFTAAESFSSLTARVHDDESTHLCVFVADADGKLSVAESGAWLSASLSGDTESYSTVTVSATENTEVEVDRSGVVVVVSNTVYEALSSNFANMLESGAIKEDYEQYIALGITQKGADPVVENVGFTVTDDDGNEYLVTIVDNADSGINGTNRVVECYLGTVPPKVTITADAEYGTSSMVKVTYPTLYPKGNWVGVGVSPKSNSNYVVITPGSAFNGPLGVTFGWYTRSGTDAAYASETVYYTIILHASDRP